MSAYRVIESADGWFVIVGPRTTGKHYHSIADAEKAIREMEQEDEDEEERQREIERPPRPS
jgi:hypothetical protein